MQSIDGFMSPTSTDHQLILPLANQCADRDPPTEFYDFLNVNSDSATTASEVTDPTRRPDDHQPHEVEEEEEEEGEVDQTSDNSRDGHCHRRENSSALPFFDFL